MGNKVAVQQVEAVEDAEIAVLCEQIEPHVGLFAHKLSDAIAQEPLFQGRVHGPIDLTTWLFGEDPNKPIFSLVFEPEKIPMTVTMDKASAPRLQYARLSLATLLRRFEKIERRRG